MIYHRGLFFDNHMASMSKTLDDYVFTIIHCSGALIWHN